MWHMYLRTQQKESLAKHSLEFNFPKVTVSVGWDEELLASQDAGQLLRHQRLGLKELHRPIALLLYPDQICWCLAWLAWTRMCQHQPGKSSRMWLGVLQTPTWGHEPWSESLRNVDRIRKLTIRVCVSKVRPQRALTLSLQPLIWSCFIKSWCHNQHKPWQGS